MVSRAAVEKAPKGEFFEKVIQDDGSIVYKVYKKKTKQNPQGETRHHAEQQMKTSLKKGEELKALAPSRMCCSECRKALGDDICKVPKHLQGEG